MFGADGGAEALQDEYLKATLKKAGLPDHLEVAEMQIEYAIKDSDGNIWRMLSRDSAFAAAETGDTVVVSETIRTEWRKATPRNGS